MAILKLQATNLEITHHKTPYSELSSPVEAATTTSNVINPMGLKVGYFLLFGEVRGESSEVSLLSSVSGTQLTHAALKYAHPASTPVYCIPYNQIKFYRNRDGVETLIATVDMQFGSSTYSTEFYGDTQPGDEFATSYYNSSTASETGKSEYVSMDGFAHNSKLGIAIRAAYLFQDKDNNVITLDTWFDWQHEAMGHLIRKTQDKDQGYMLTSETNSTPTEMTEYDATRFSVPDDLRVLKLLWVNYEATANWVQAYPEEINDSSPYDYYSKGVPGYAFNGDEVVIRPGTAVSMMTRYYPVIARLATDSSTPPKPIDSYDAAIINYMLMRAFAFAKNEDMVEIYERLWDKSVIDMIDEVDKRQRDRPRKVLHSNPVFAMTRDGDSYI